MGKLMEVRKDACHGEKRMIRLYPPTKRHREHMKCVTV